MGWIKRNVSMLLCMALLAAVSFVVAWDISATYAKAKEQETQLAQLVTKVEELAASNQRLSDALDKRIIAGQTIEIKRTQEYNELERKGQDNPAFKTWSMAPIPDPLFDLLNTTGRMYSTTSTGQYRNNSSGSSD